MTFVIKDVECGRYRAKPDARREYTSRLDKAWRFPSEEAATAALIPGAEVIRDVTHRFAHFGADRRFT